MAGGLCKTWLHFVRPRGVPCVGQTRPCDEHSHEVLAMGELPGKCSSAASCASPRVHPPAPTAAPLVSSSQEALSSYGLAIPPCSLHATDDAKWEETGFQVDSVACYSSARTYGELCPVYYRAYLETH